MRKLGFYILCVFNLSCVEDISVDPDLYINQLVLNGFLHPDSVFKVKLTKTFPLGGQAPVVEDASVLLFEDLVEIGEFTYTKDSYYVFDGRPRVGSTYSIGVDASGYEPLSASDTIPTAPGASIRLTNENRFKLSLEDNDPAENVYWVSVMVVDNNLENPQQIDTTTLSYLATRSLVPDPFNSSFDNTSGLYEYNTFFRIEDSAFPSNKLNFEFLIENPFGTALTDIPEDSVQQIFVNVISVSNTMDYYLKSSVIEALNQVDETDDINPFYEPVYVYSNIEKGTGIFAAHNSVRLQVR